MLRTPGPFATLSRELPSSSIWPRCYTSRTRRRRWRGVRTDQRRRDARGGRGVPGSRGGAGGLLQHDRGVRRGHRGRAHGGLARAARDVVRQDEGGGGTDRARGAHRRRGADGCRSAARFGVWRPRQGELPAAGPGARAAPLRADRPREQPARDGVRQGRGRCRGARSDAPGGGRPHLQRLGRRRAHARRDHRGDLRCVGANASEVARAAVAGAGGGGLLERAARVAGARSPVSRATIDKYTEDIAVDSRRIRDELGFAPRYDLRAGWREAIAGMREAGELEGR